MPTPSPAILAILATFAPAFTTRTFAHAQVLVYGTLLAVGRRTVTAALRAVGLAEEQHFTTHHRVLNRAVWSPLRLSRLLLGLLVSTFLPDGVPLVVVIDETLSAALGQEDRVQGTVPRRGALTRLPRGDQSRGAVAVRDAAGAGALERATLGLPVPERARAGSRDQCHAG